MSEFLAMGGYGFYVWGAYLRDGARHRGRARRRCARAGVPREALAAGTRTETVR